MKKLQETYPMQTRKEFIKKTLEKGMLGKILFGTKFGVTSWHNYAENFTPNREEATVALIRGFKADEDFLGKFRIAPGPCLLDMMLDRCSKFNYSAFRSEMLRLQTHERSLVEAGIFIPGHAVSERNYWLFPMIVENKDLFIQYMLQKGVIPAKSST